MKHGILILLILTISFKSFGQSTTINGVVTDQAGQTLPGVNVMIVGSLEGAVTDFNGEFKLTASPNDVLRFSFIGYKPIQITVGSKTNMTIQMEEDVETLGEVVVVGYGSQKKSDVAGSVVSVEVEEATAIPTTNVSEMLRGRAAGVQVNLGDARPGGNSNIVIRGNVSVAPGGNAPFVVVDGVPFDDLNDIPPDDIASIEILKDAASTAIYGSRASNGVILVTTKKGKSGKATINYHGYTSTQSVIRNFDQYDGQEFIELRREANRNRFTGLYLNDENIFSPFELQTIENQEFVDWEDLVLQDATIQSHSLSFSGGGENTKVFSSLNYFDQNGIIPNSGFERGAFKLNIDQKLNDKLSLNAILNYQLSNQDRETGGLNFTTRSPLARAFDEDNELVKLYLGPSDIRVNPLWDQRESVDETKTNLADITLNLSYDILPNLSYSLNTFVRNRNTNRGLYRSSLHSAGDEGIDGFGLLSNTLFRQVLIENIVNYKPQLGDAHSLDFTGVNAFDQQNNEYTQIDKSGFTNDALAYNGNATVLLNNFRNVSQRRLLSYMGRVRYGFRDRYLVEATARADGASVFAENNKWGFFPAASVAWKMHNETFMEAVPVVNELKLRASYGATGNQGINSLESLGRADDLPYIFGGQTVAGATASSRLPNPNLRWETTTTLNTAVDFTLFNNILNGTVEYYKANTTDLLLDRAISGTTGFQVSRFNVGELQNQGIEAAVTSYILERDDIGWTLGVIFSRNVNEVISLTGELDENGEEIDINDTSGRRLSVGESINNIWLPKYDGIFQEGDDIAASGNPLAQPGDVRVIDQDGNGQIDSRDNVFINTDPDWFGSVNSTFRLKGFELFADLYIVQGATRLNTVLADGELWKGSINGIRTDYYTPEFPSTEFPRPKPDTHLHLFPFAVRDASYIRLRTVTLSYAIPNEAFERIGLKRGKVYLTGTNLLTFTDFKSYSPEQNPLNGSETAFPETRNITVGLKFGF
ncbi:TonB-linked outer membrane protein, SusC/RagA family [Marivirga sericea]|uniref:TonB-linked outer membrane protein, SusC/RagA family n=1 Tax=Marivirga sericea TaxID=1028 RepID=A0A1X7I6I0_9BACT|nr:TonB-dependent receptor [Marivirga sericea]SMG09699.1 TonB-linked outer membrane protein, SusC/RagA family [Marivirga sericea]